jgi:hypothetical protein
MYTELTQDCALKDATACEGEKTEAVCRPARTSPHC